MATATAITCVATFIWQQPLLDLVGGGMWQRRLLAYILARNCNNMCGNIYMATATPRPSRWRKYVATSPLSGNQSLPPSLIHFLKCLLKFLKSRVQNHATPIYSKIQNSAPNKTKKALFLDQNIYICKHFLQSATAPANQ